MARTRRWEGDDIGTQQSGPLALFRLQRHPAEVVQSYTSSNELVQHQTDESLHLSRGGGEAENSIKESNGFEYATSGFLVWVVHQRPCTETHVIGPRTLARLRRTPFTPDQRRPPSF